MFDYYDRAGRPIGRDRWVVLLSDKNYQRVAFDENGSGSISVSTVWLGMDHQWGDGPPLIFETMVFGGERDEQQWRWSTEAQARAGHGEICSAVLRTTL